MGMRLVVTLTQNQEDICKIYYHWSAYTSSALYEVQKIAHWMKENPSDDIALSMIRFCEQNGGGIDGGIDSDEWSYISKLYPDCIFKSEAINRSNGLIAISNSSMAEMQAWSEGDVEIDLDNNMVSFGIFCDYESLEEYKDETEYDDEEDGELTLADIPDVGIDIGDFNMDEIDHIIDALDKACGIDGLVRNGNEIYELC